MSYLHVAIYIYIYLFYEFILKKLIIPIITAVHTDSFI